MSLQSKKGSSLVDLYNLNRDLLKKPASKKPTKRQNSSVASKFSTKLEDPAETCPKKFAKWERKDLFLAVLKILSVVVVALMTKRIVLGATLSAFCLFFLEYVVKYLYRFLRRLLICRTKITKVSFTRTEWDNSAGGSVPGCSSLTVSTEEVQDLPADSDSDVGFSDSTNLDSSKISEFEDRGSGKGSLESDQDSNCEGLSCKGKCSRKEKVKCKMKKLVPKKIRKSIKKRSCFKREGTDILEEDNCEAKDYDTELDASDDSEDNTIDVRSLISKYWFFCFIALAGLSQGRSLAVVFTLFWCLIVKLVEFLINRRELH
ncbi:hypothetical protein POM88_022569 [Heracleum sosnowskyi]|uniref:Uncharacterized protein n=1 Tax=Heracleum sosnowskyi TaxID=360622 RepID=A0AAD8IFF6_9APIA|nr:hypothetical protein POM88_022569 [Heracleum sosnowskyi]